MESAEKEIHFQSTNSYSTLNSLTSKTKNVWFVTHGIGYLSKKFIKYFETLDPDENYIIAPQAPSKYYLGFDFKNVGACWLTKENTETDKENVLNYLDAVYNSEQIPAHLNLIALGYSQGVSVITRWIARRKLSCKKIILYAGGIPVELKPEDYAFLETEETRIISIYGDRDPFFNGERLRDEKARARILFAQKAEIRFFSGGHEFKSSLLSSFISD